MSSMNQHRRQQFFDYFRQRLATASREDVQLPDRLLLLSACLDALAKHWHSTADRREIPAALRSDERLRRFLLKHGGHPAFERVSAPMFRKAEGQEIGSFPFSAYKLNEMNKTRDWREDPTFDELSARDALVRWSYPGILYVDLRCAWVHNFVSENEDIIINDADFLGRGEPYYRFVSPFDPAKPQIGRFLLMMPLSFLLATADRAIHSFESETTTRDVLPFEE
jgi:hypothetical protein